MKSVDKIKKELAMNPIPIIVGTFSVGVLAGVAAGITIAVKPYALDPTELLKVVEKSGFVLVKINLLPPVMDFVQE